MALTQFDDARRRRVPAALGARRHRHVVDVSGGQGQARSHHVPAHLEQIRPAASPELGLDPLRPPPPLSWAEPRRNRRRRQTHVHGVASLGAFLPDGEHLPVEHPGVGQVDEELAVGPADEEDAMGVIHRGDVRSLRS